MPYDELQLIVNEAIRDYFTSALGRPALFNRFADNIVVFDFIRPELARQILQVQLRNVADRLARELGIRLEFGNAATQRLDAWCATVEVLAFGGRGIGSVVESKLISPLTRYLFDADVQSGRVIVDDIQTDGGLVELIIRHEL